MKTEIKKTSLVITLFICLMSILAACGTPPEDKTYDGAFIKDLKKGLMARWDLEQNDGETEEQYYERLVSAELNSIDDYTDKKFEDTELQERAINYINLLHKQKDALKYFNTDYSNGIDLWDDAYKKRTQAVRQFIDDYDITFPDKYKDTLKEFDNAATVADENDKLEEDIQTMLDNLKFDMVKDEYGYTYYEAIIENISDKTFDNLSIDVSLLDKDGVILDTAYTYAENLAPGRKAKLEFSTDKDFEAMEFTADYY